MTRSEPVVVWVSKDQKFRAILGTYDDSDDRVIFFEKKDKNRLGETIWVGTLNGTDRDDGDGEEWHEKRWLKTEEVLIDFIGTVQLQAAKIAELEKRIGEAK